MVDSKMVDKRGDFHWKKSYYIIRSINSIVHLKKTINDI